MTVPLSVPTTGPMQRAPVTAVIFDLDGILVDSEPLLFEAERQMLAEHGVDFTAEMKRPLIGLGGREILDAFVDLFALSASVEQMSARKMALYLELAAEAAGFAATAEFARALSAEGLRLAIASGSSPEGIDVCLRAVGLRELFTVTVSSQSVARGKPAPDVFLAAASQLDADPAECVVVEDAPAGVLAAHAAGMRCIAIPSVTDPLDPAFENADLLVAGGMSGARAEDLLTWVRGVGAEG